MENTVMEFEGEDKEHMKTLSSCISSLTMVGFDTQFKVLPEGIESLTTHKVYEPDDVTLKNFYRFEGESDPADNAILYAIETNTGEKGVMVDAYGIYTDDNVTEFMKEVENRNKRAHKKGKE